MPSKKVFKKRVHTKRHFKRRFYERYDIDLTSSDVKRIENAIKQKDGNLCKFIKDVSSTKSQWQIKIEDIWFNIMYSNVHKTPITVLFWDQGD